MNQYTIKATNIAVPFFSTFFVLNKQGKRVPSVRFYRFGSVIGLHLLFFLSYFIDFQVLEGTLSGSRFLGFHLIDPFVTIEVFLAHHEIPRNLIIGCLTVSLVYLLVGGRGYCSWVCPYGLLSEIGEKLHVNLAKRKLAKNLIFSRYNRYIFFALICLLTYITKLLVYEVINPIGIITRAVVYGWSVAVLVVLVIFLAEVFFSRRLWCRHICPVGVAFSGFGYVSPTKIAWSKEDCNHCGVCKDVCFVSHVLNFTNKAEADGYVKSGDCTLCGRCVDVCHSNALKFDTKLKKLI